MKSWLVAFEEADEVEREGDRLASLDEESVVERATPLSIFVREQLRRMLAVSVPSSSSAATPSGLIYDSIVVGADMPEQPDIEVDETEVEVKSDNLSRQMCRNWLKNKYLGLGSPCTDSSCGRKHALHANAGLLYSDFSFKGLTKGQRKAIIAALPSSRDVDASDRESKVCDDEVQSAVVRQPKRGREQDPPSFAPPNKVVSRADTSERPLTVRKFHSFTKFKKHS